MEHQELTSAEVAARLVDLERDGDYSYRLRQIRNWQNLGFLDVVGRSGRGPKAAALLTSDALFKSRLFVMLSMIGFDATRIRAVDADLRSNAYTHSLIDLPRSMRNRPRKGVIRDAVRGINEGERWNYEIAVSDNGEIHSGPVWPDRAPQVEESDPDFDAAKEYAQRHGILSARGQAAVHVVVDLNKLFEPLLRK